MMKRKDPLSFCFVFYIDRLFMDWLLDLCEIASIYNSFIKKYWSLETDRQGDKESKNGIWWTGQSQCESQNETHTQKEQMNACEQLLTRLPDVKLISEIK